MSWRSANGWPRNSTRVTATPRLRFSDDRIWTLVMLLSGVLKNTDPSTQLYGDGLTAAISALLFANPGEGGADNWKGLAPWQLRRVVEYLDAHPPKHVALGHLATLHRMSPPHFNPTSKAPPSAPPQSSLLCAYLL